MRSIIPVHVKNWVELTANDNQERKSSTNLFFNLNWQLIIIIITMSCTFSGSLDQQHNNSNAKNKNQNYKINKTLSKI